MKALVDHTVWPDLRLDDRLEALMVWIGNYISEIVSFVAGLAGGSLLTLTLTHNRVTGSGSNVDQSRARAGGDIVGRDKNADRR